MNMRKDATLCFRCGKAFEIGLIEMVRAKEQICPACCSQDIDHAVKAQGATIPGPQAMIKGKGVPE
jgi:hypothetical protein